MVMRADGTCRESSSAHSGQTAGLKRGQDGVRHVVAEHVAPDLGGAVLTEGPNGQGCPQVRQVDLCFVVEQGIDQGETYYLRLGAPKNGSE
jgi:hypothetical protein